MLCTIWKRLVHVMRINAVLTYYSPAIRILIVATCLSSIWESSSDKNRNKKFNSRESPNINMYLKKTTYLSSLYIAISLGVEHSLSKRKVVGSNPTWGWILWLYSKRIVCLLYSVGRVVVLWANRKRFDLDSEQV